MNRVWRPLGASVLGTSHGRSGIPCQDANNYLVLPNGFMVAAIADGAGSAKHADRGASLAVDCAVKHLSARLTAGDSLDEACLKLLLEDTIQEVRSALESECSTPSVSNSDPVRLSDLATTLLVCVVTDSHVGACQIGDGAIVELSGSGEVRTLTKPARGEYINETTFVTSDDFADALSCVVKDSRETRGIVLFTDGIQSLAMRLSDDTPFDPFFHNIEKYASSPGANSEALKSFLESERVCERTDDDKTLVVAVRHSLPESQ